MSTIESTANLTAAIGYFDFSGTLIDYERFGGGHINDTFLVRFEENGKIREYTLQRLNVNVFKKPVEVMSNILGVTDYIKKIIADKGGDNERGALTVVKTLDGKPYFIDEDGFFWRAFVFVTGAISLDQPEDENDFYQSAVAFGEFQNMLNSYPAETLYETIPDFHNTPKRYENFLKAVEIDSCGRASGVQREIEFINARRDFMSVLEDSYESGRIPKRVTHNDTKMNNVLLDKNTREPICVIDLDTIMPGYSVTDFGDSIRFGASTAAEDEKDLTKVSLSLSMFETYTKGYLRGCGETLTDNEIELLPTGAKMMTLECGMRFLTDYLEGDTYFKTAYDEHNLVRCRTQIKLVEEIEKHWDKLAEIVRKYK